MDVSKKTVSTLEGLPFYNLIGGPLNDCIRAQADAALTTVNFIKSVGLEQEKDGVTEAIYVHFTFVQNGRKVTISVPLLTIVPIPYIAINSIDIKFKATVSGVETDSFSSDFSSQYNEDYSRNYKSWNKRKTTSLKSSFSSKRDSKCTQDSSFSVESTIDVEVHAGQESMPAGMAKVLEMLGAAMDLVSPDGELSVNDTTFYVESGKKARVIAQYKTPKGLYDSEGIKCKGATGKPNAMDKTMEFDLDAKSDPYEISCGEVQKVQVRVIELPASAAKSSSSAATTA